MGSVACGGGPNFAELLPLWYWLMREMARLGVMRELLVIWLAREAWGYPAVKNNAS